MKSEWKTIRADEFCSLVTDGTHDSPKPQAAGRKLITSKHLKGYYLDFDSANWISSEDYKKVIARSSVEQWDILYSMIGTIGNVYLEKNPVVDYACKNVGIFKFGGNCNKAYWMYYYLKSPQAMEFIKAHLRGTTQLYVPLATLREMPVPVPDEEEMNKIVAILRTLDDKIQCSIKINDNLEQQAQAIFKEWFIENPENNEWSTGTFSELIKTTLNGDWGKEAPTGNNTEKVYCIRGADIPEVKAGNKGKMPTRYILPKNFVKKQLTAGDIVVEISGGSPTQSTGRCTAITQSLLDRYDSGMVCTNFCKAIKPKEGYSLFIYYYWQYLYGKGIFFSYENGTTGIKNLDFSGFIETETILIPPVDKVIAFDDYCKSIFNQIFANGKQNEHLAVLRDTLLPKLMSGELDVSNLQL
jgi:type I restriction enzyme S subunit